MDQLSKIDDQLRRLDPQPTRDLTVNERITQLSAEVQNRAAEVAEWGSRLHNARDEHRQTQERFNETAAALEEAEQRLRMFLAEQGLYQPEATPAYRS